MTDDNKPISYGSPDAWGGANIRAQGVRETKPIAIVGNDSDGAFIEFEEKDSALLPPAPPEPERRTVWLNVYADYEGVSSFHSKENCDYHAGAARQGEAVPVSLERGADGNWRVVAEKTAKELAAEEMYDGLHYIGNLVEDPHTKRLYEIILNALAKAEGRG